MKKFLAALITVVALTGCGGGGGNGDGSAQDGLDHNELAQEFVNALNATGDYNVTLAKSSTYQHNFIVVYDYDLGTYDAVNISGYVRGSNPADFIENSGRAYYDLNFYPGYYDWDYTTSYDYWCECWVTDIEEYWVPDEYQHPATGIVFEKVQSTGKDLEAYAALAEEAVIESRAESVAAKFGLSVGRSKEVVRLSMAWKRAGGKDLSAKDQDAFSQEVLGFSITEAKAAAKNIVAGDEKALDELVTTAAQTNEMSPENVRELVQEYFFK